jgi:hypothetical protein
MYGSRWVNNIKMDVREKFRHDIEWIEMTQDSIYFAWYGNRVTNLYGMITELQTSFLLIPIVLKLGILTLP